MCVECTHKNRLDEAILMSTHNIQIHDKKTFLNISYLELSKNFVGNQKTSSNKP